MSASICGQVFGRGRCLLVRLSILQRSVRHNQYLTGNRNILKLHQRGIFKTLLPESSGDELHRACLSAPQCVYCGFDPTAPSLHVGHLVTIMALLHCQRGGHHILAVIGGATAKIGDPSGRTSERQRMDDKEVDKNACGIQETLERIFTHHDDIIGDGRKVIGDREILNNAAWYSKINLVEFLTGVGRRFRMGTMLRRDSVASRLERPDGMNFTEFCYQIFQAYDWLHLFKTHRCAIQLGGNDQTGNIMSGYDLISRVTDEPVWGVTVPLITSTSGDKLGKTAGNAVWLNPDMTPPFELYQYFLRLMDSDINNYLKLLTFFTDTVISDIMVKHRDKPEKRYAQRKLAEEVTKLVHGEAGLESAVKCTSALYSENPLKLAELSETELDELFRNTPVTEMFLDPGITIIEAVMKAKCFNRSVDAVRVIEEGGVSMNHQKVLQPDYVLVAGQHILPNGITLIRIGKKNHYLIKWIGGL